MPQGWLLTILATVAGAALIGLGRLAFSNPPIYRFVAWPLAVFVGWATSIYLAYAFGFFSAMNKGPEAFSPAWVFAGCCGFGLILMILAIISEKVERQAKANERRRD
jgi:hypothetical protein